MMPAAAHIYSMHKSVQAPALTGGSFGLWGMALARFGLEQHARRAQDRARQAVLVGLDEDDDAV